MNERQLCDCCKGTHAVVCRVEGDCSFTARLREIGLVPGQTIQILQAGNPFHIIIGDARMCIRTEQLRGISVLPLSAQHAAA